MAIITIDLESDYVRKKLIALVRVHALANSEAALLRCGVRSGAKGKRAQDLGTQAQASWQNGEKALVV